MIIKTYVLSISIFEQNFVSLLYSFLAIFWEKRMLESLFTSDFNFSFFPFVTENVFESYHYLVCQLKLISYPTSLDNISYLRTLISTWSTQLKEVLGQGQWSYTFVIGTLGGGQLHSCIVIFKQNLAELAFFTRFYPFVNPILCPLLWSVCQCCLFKKRILSHDFLLADDNM